MNLDVVPQDVIEHFKKIKEEEASLQEKGIYINYVHPVVFNERKVWAIGNKIYNGAVYDTFHDFIQFILKEALGFGWINEQLSLPEGEQHFIVKCFSRFEELKIKIMASPQKVMVGTSVRIPSNGWTKSMLSLAFDIATLKHTSNLPDLLLKRLRIPREYQGARHEIMAAAILARLGFTIEWLDEEHIPIPHCEFIATHNNTGTKIAVEAKSRHRPGILHMPGDIDVASSYKGDVQRLLKESYKKDEYGKMPFVIFIDVNSRMKESSDFKDIPWVKDILDEARGGKLNSKDNPSLHNAIYFTNFSFHYQTEVESALGQSLGSLPTFSLYPIPDNSIHNGIMAALHHYGDIPDINVED